MSLAAYTGVDKGLFKILSDLSGRKAGTTLTAHQDVGAREPMDAQAPKPGQSTVDDVASVSSHIQGKLLFYGPIMDIIKVVQINLHHSRAASALMCMKLLADNIDVALIQEPWLSGGKIRGLRCKGGLNN